MEIGAGDRQARRRRTADPEVGDAPGILTLDELVLVDALAEASHLEALEQRGIDRWHVDVDELAGGEAVFEDVLRDGGRRPPGQLEVGMLVVLLRDGERRAVVDDRL